mmetsp:Transcript_16796/g.37773  ORF Transcript_16796/g.37773 Transcript_16796/m.37773 type:complete len:221 (-) Transcript_16796:758-1420(-)
MVVLLTIPVVLSVSGSEDKMTAPASFPCSPFLPVSEGRGLPLDDLLLTDATFPITTGRGTAPSTELANSRSLASSMPSRPKLPTPQDHTLPSAVVSMVCSSPQETPLARTSPGKSMRCAASIQACEHPGPIPSQGPGDPMAYASPLLVTATTCRLPAEMDVTTVCRLPGGRGLWGSEQGSTGEPRGGGRGIGRADVAGSSSPSRARGRAWVTYNDPQRYA